MARTTTDDVASLVDAFVERINAQPREPKALDEVPPFLRENADDSQPDVIDGCTNWRIVKCDNSRRLDELQKRTGRSFPPSFEYFVDHYAFPAFEFGSVMFFANTGMDTYWELEKRLSQDPHMSPQLLEAGFLQIGNPFFYHYDPVCFECNGPRIEKRMVQLDHEAILQQRRMIAVREIASSFVEFLRAAVR
jgi:hypothetical protein